jgi:hypothetical protein
MDQRCEACKKPKEFWLLNNEGEDFILNSEPVLPEGWTHVIEKSAFDFQCKQVTEMAETFNKSSEYWQGMIKDLQAQLLTEKAEVGRLMALNKRRSKA